MTHDDTEQPPHGSILFCGWKGLCPRCGQGKMSKSWLAIVDHCEVCDLDYRAYGNENWEFAPDGLMRNRHASINEHPISEEERKFRWPLGRRPDDHPGLSDLGL